MLRPRGTCPAHGPHPALPQRGEVPVLYAEVSLAASFTSTGTDGPIVVDRYSVRRYWPLAAAGLLRTSASMRALRFPSRASGGNDALPIATWPMPAFSLRYSTQPPLTLRTA